MMADIELKKPEKQEIPEKDTNSNNIKEDDKSNETEFTTPKTKYIEKNTTKFFFLICLLGMLTGIAFEMYKVPKDTLTTSSRYIRPKYWVYSKARDVDSKQGLLKHVHLVLERLGYEKTTNATPWTLLWTFDWPFIALSSQLHQLQPHQKVNHFPGTQYITNKVDLATSQSKYIPKAFRLPKNNEDFLKYAAENTGAMFVEKNNQHRGVILKNVSDIDVTSGSKFVQEYVQRPFLVDGHKFDIGVYVVLTSVDPLRAYWYKGDVLFRFCKEKYYPLDPQNLDKYVVIDKYLPAWKVPSLSRAYSLGFSVKDAFDVYVRSKGKDPSRIWEEVQQSIVEVFLNKEKHIIQALKKYNHRENFFELMRFDLLLDEDLKVFLMEANMSPNLYSADFAHNRMLYEQLLYGAFSLVGVATPLNSYHTDDPNEEQAVTNMVASDKSIAVFGEQCDACVDCDVTVCGLCAGCRAPALRASLLRAHVEHTHRADYRRLYPGVMQPNAPVEDLSHLSEMNRLQHMWYQGKCNMDVTWCS